MTRKAKGKKPNADAGSEVLVLPPLPSYVFTALGEVPIVLVDVIRHDGKETHDLGFADFHTRTITIRADLAAAALFHTMFHEQGHFMLFDAGVRLSERMEEAVCDAYATMRFQEMVTRR